METETTDVHTATVVFYDLKRGYGFARFDDNDEEIFFHHSGLINGFVPAKEDHIQFSIGANRGRPCGIQITKIQ